MRHCQHDHSSLKLVELINWNMQRLKRSSTSSVSVIAPSFISRFLRANVAAKTWHVQFCVWVVTGAVQLQEGEQFAYIYWHYECRYADNCLFTVCHNCNACDGLPWLGQLDARNLPRLNEIPSQNVDGLGTRLETIAFFSPATSRDQAIVSVPLVGTFLSHRISCSLWKARTTSLNRLVLVSIVSIAVVVF